MQITVRERWHKYFKIPRRLRIGLRTSERGGSRDKAEDPVIGNRVRPLCAKAYCKYILRHYKYILTEQPLVRNNSSMKTSDRSVCLDNRIACLEPWFFEFFSVIEFNLKHRLDLCYQP
jgi:hypothetical protein